MAKRKVNPAPEFATVDELVSNLKPHPRNYKSHPPEQVAQIIASLKEHGFYKNIVVARDNTILAGHGVYTAVQQMGLTTVPVRRLDIDPDSPAALKVMTSDNELGLLAERDDQLFSVLLTEIQTSTGDLLGTGYTDLMLGNLLQSFDPVPDAPQKHTPYSRKIVAPLYEPQGEPPEVYDLFDTSVTQRLVDAVQAADGITDQERGFLLLAAQRHTVLRFNRIADYYAHASPQMQKLMEDSALVIIDFDRAIELGFVQLTEKIAGLVAEEYPDDDLGGDDETTE